MRQQTFAMTQWHFDKQPESIQKLKFIWWRMSDSFLVVSSAVSAIAKSNLHVQASGCAIYSSMACASPSSSLVCVPPSPKMIAAIWLSKQMPVGLVMHGPVVANVTDCLTSKIGQHRLCRQSQCLQVLQ